MIKNCIFRDQSPRICIHCKAFVNKGWAGVGAREGLGRVGKG